MLSLLIGFAAPFIPDILKIFTAKADRNHEITLFNLQSDRDKSYNSARLEERTLDADGAALVEAYRFADKPAGYKWVEAVNALVRPGITGWYCLVYGCVKIAQYNLALASTGDWKYAITTIWSPADMEAFNVILGFWFGSRARRAANG